MPVPGNPAGLPYIAADIAWILGRPVWRIKAYRQCGSIMEQTDVKHSVAAENWVGTMKGTNGCQSSTGWVA